MSSDAPVVLHLSDLHFGAEPTARQVNDRELCLAALTEYLGKLEAEWRPQAVVVTGDIAWAARKSDYQQASEWLSQVARLLELPHSSFVLCPGNHDVDRKVADEYPRGDRDDCFRMFANGIPSYMDTIFANYVEFCTSFGSAKLSIGGRSTYLAGSANVAGINFVSLNTAWFSRRHDDRQKLRIAMPLVEMIERDGKLVAPGARLSRPFTVAAMHHPPSWLSDDETHFYRQQGDGAYLHLAARCHLILSGHTHEDGLGHGRAKTGCIELGGGATFENAGHPNQCLSIRLRSKRLEYRRVSYTNTPRERRWSSSDINSVPYDDSGGLDVDVEPELTRVEALDRCARFAADYVDTKSRALTPQWQPQITALKVRVQKPSRLGGDSPDNFGDRIALADTLRYSNRVILSGDLGSGKSTLVALLAESINRRERRPAIIVPASRLNPSSNGSGPVTLDQIVECVRQRLFQEFTHAALKATLLDGVLVVVDGLDEVPMRVARRIVEGLDALPTSYPRIQVLVTSRSVYHDYALGQSWMPVEMSRLEAGDRQAILLAAEVATGAGSDDGKRNTDAMMARLQEDALLDAVATTPLALRLLHSRLRGRWTTARTSIASLLHELLVDRVRGWEDLDLKENPAKSFCDEVAGTDARLQMLCIIALEAESVAGASSSIVQQRLESHEIGRSLSPKARSQILEFYKWVGLIRLVDDKVDFALRPFQEVALVPYITRQLQTSPLQVRAESWRAVSFAAALKTEAACLREIEQGLIAYLEAYIDNRMWIIPACFIVAEAGDSGIAGIAIQALQRRKRERPLYQFAGQERATAVSVARTLVLAGNAGFDWFFAEYMDPKYPYMHWGSRVPDLVFEEWISATDGAISEPHRSLLDSFVRRHIHFDGIASHHALPLAILAASSEISAHTQAGYIARLLTHHSLPISRRARVRMQRLLVQDRAGVLDALMRHIIVGYEYSVQCAYLWLEGVPERAAIPEAVFTAAFRGRGNWGGRYYEPALVKLLVRRVGGDVWLRFCRWELISNDSAIAGGAALELLDIDGSSLRLVKPQLLGILHDGYGSREAEAQLERMVITDPDRVAASVGAYLARSGSSPFDGGHSGWWRIFLSALSQMKTSGTQLLAMAAPGAGAMMLARNASLRQEFHRLGQSRRGPEYTETLYDALRLGDAAARSGAARILVSMGKYLPEALLVCARVSEASHGQSAEWDSFCVTARYESTVVDALWAFKDRLSGRGREFVLRLALNNDRVIDQDDAAFLLRESYSLAGIEPLARGEVGYEIMRKVIDGSNDYKVVRRFAQYALECHRSVLGPAELALYETLTFGSSMFVNQSVANEYKRLKDDTGLRQMVISSGDGLLARFRKQFPRHLLATAVDSDAIWEALLWELFSTDDGMPMSREPIGSDILRLGHEFENAAVAIGAAALSLCQADHVKGVRNEEAVAWLALLAHEFCLDASQVPPQPISVATSHQSIVPALRERGLVCDPTNPPLVPVVGRTRRSSMEGVLPVVRDGMAITESACEEIVRCISGEEPVRELAALKVSGVQPNIVALCIAFIWNQEPSVQDALRLLDDDALSLPHPADGHDLDCVERVAHGAQLALQSLLITNEEGVVASLHDAVKADDSNSFNAVRMLYQIGVKLEPDAAVAALAQYSRRPYLNSRDVLMHILACIGMADADRVGQLLEECMDSMALQSIRDGSMLDIAATLALPLCYWTICRRSSVSAARLFRGGVSALMRIGTGRNLPGDFGMNLGPLLRSAPVDLVRDAISVENLGQDDWHLFLLSVALGRSPEKYG